MRLEKPSYIFEIGPRRKCRNFASACLARHKSGSIVVSISQHITISMNNNGGDTRRKYIATVEKQPARYLRLTSIKKRSNSPDTRCHVRRRLSLDRQPSGFWLCRQVLSLCATTTFHCGSIFTIGQHGQLSKRDAESSKNQLT